MYCIYVLVIESSSFQAQLYFNNNAIVSVCIPLGMRYRNRRRYVVTCATYTSACVHTTTVLYSNTKLLFPLIPDYNYV